MKMDSSNTKHILIADDEEDLRDALNEKLISEGFKVSVAKDGDEALATALAKKPDLILLDLKMPNKDGYEVLEELNKDDWGKNVPILVLTNIDDIESAARVIDSHGYEYLVKSYWRLEDIVQKIKAKLNIQ